MPKTDFITTRQETATEAIRDALIALHTAKGHLADARDALVGIDLVADRLRGHYAVIEGTVTTLEIERRLLRIDSARLTAQDDPRGEADR